MANTLLIAKKATEQALIEGRDALTEQQISLISSYYAGAIAAGRAVNQPDRNGELSRAAKLVERFATREDLRDLAPAAQPGRLRDRSLLPAHRGQARDALAVLNQLLTTGPWMPPALAS
jgi:hypothetical protein